MSKLTNKVAIVTGGSRGIGAAIAKLNVFMVQKDDCAPLVSEPYAAHPIRKGCPGGQLCKFWRGFKALPSSRFPIKNAFSLGSHPERTGAIFGCFDQCR